MVNVSPPLSFSRFPLDFVLGSVARVRVVRALFAHGGALSVTRIAADAILTPHGTRLALASLERASAVVAIGTGRTRLFCINQNNSVAAALAPLFDRERHAFEQLLREIDEATSIDEVEAVWLFGSVARGTDTQRSDVDLAVLLDSSLEAEKDAVLVLLTLRLSGILRSSPSILAFTRDDIASLRSSGAPLWSNLVRDAVTVRGIRPEDVRKLRRHA